MGSFLWAFILLVRVRQSLLQHKQRKSLGEANKTNKKKMSKSLQKSVGINLRNLSNYALRYCFHVRDVFIMVGRKAGGVVFC